MHHWQRGQHCQKNGHIGMRSAKHKGGTSHKAILAFGIIVHTAPDNI